MKIIMSNDDFETLLERLKSSTSVVPQHQTLQDICSLGVPARLVAIKAALDIKDTVRGMAAIADLIEGVHNDVEPIHEPALILLAENKSEASTKYLCELAYILERKVSRTTLKKALLHVWEKSPEQRENIAYTLRRRGFRRFLGWWI